MRYPKKAHTLENIVQFFYQTYSMYYRLSQTKCLFLSYNKTVIDFDAVDIRIYQPSKVIFTSASGLSITFLRLINPASVNITFLRLIKPYIHLIEVNNCILLYDWIESCLLIGSICLDLHKSVDLPENWSELGA